MGDTWLFPWQGKDHLFYLETRYTPFDYVGHAVSNDLVHWKTRPSIPVKGKKGAWNEREALTGTLIQRDGTFFMFIG